MIRKFAFLAALALAGCTTPTAAGPGSAGAPQASTNLAQTARDQASIPGQSYGGHVYWNFASQGAAEIQQRILTIASEQKWSAEQITAALASTNGAPGTVTITAANVQGGDADNAGAGTGGSGSAAGSGTVQRP